MLERGRGGANLSYDCLHFRRTMLTLALSLSLAVPYPQLAGWEKREGTGAGQAIYREYAVILPLLLTNRSAVKAGNEDE